MYWNHFISGSIHKILRRIYSSFWDDPLRFYTLKMHFTGNCEPLWLRRLMIDGINTIRCRFSLIIHVICALNSLCPLYQFYFHLAVRRERALIHISFFFREYKRKYIIFTGVCRSQLGGGGMVLQFISRHLIADVINALKYILKCFFDSVGFYPSHSFLRRWYHWNLKRDQWLCWRLMRG